MNNIRKRNCFGIPSYPPFVYPNSGGPFVYVSLNGFQGVQDNDWICSKKTATSPAPSPPSGPPPEPDIIRECSFNHPDRTFICMNSNRKLMFAGRIGVSGFNEKAKSFYMHIFLYLCYVFASMFASILNRHCTVQ